MSTLHVRQIKAAFEKLFTGIDMSDVASRPQDEKDTMYLTRSLAAYAIAIVAGIPPKEASPCVVDGFDDNGLDGIYYDGSEKRLILVQAKFIKDGNGAPDLASMLKFVKGVRDLLDGEITKFNAKVQALEPKILAGLDDSETSVVLVVAHTGAQQLAQTVKAPLDELLKELNDPTELASFRMLSQAELHSAIATIAEGAPISVEAMLSDWGQLREPYQAFYGQISAADVAAWHLQFGDRLFAKNLRKVITSSEINRTIADTARRVPRDFWYFNNGITVLCQRVKKKLLGGSDTAGGVFECDGISVVNGAQTVGSIATAFGAEPDQVKQAKISIRFISLENCPESFAAEVTRATNTQNRIEARDFASLDPEQDRLRRELFLEGKEYAFKTGEQQPAPDKGCTIDEATIALACSQPEIGLAVVAKGSIGRLWENIRKPPYTLLFSPDLSGLHLWRAVELLRAVDGALRNEQKARTGKPRAVAIHGNRFIAHQVFRKLGVPDLQLDKGNVDIAALKVAAEKATPEVLERTIAALVEQFPSSYVQSLFKNASKCMALADAVASLDRKQAKGTRSPKKRKQKQRVGAR
jgi:hypothetical protein